MAARRRAGAAAQSTQEKREEEAVSYEPPEEVPSGTILFKYNKFQQNINVACSLIPTAAVLCVFGGKSTMGAIVVGMLVTYLLDFIGWRDSTFVAVWVTIFTTMITLFMASMHLFAISILNIALVYNMILCGAACGLWATLQFSFLQAQHPRLILIFERMLFALLPATSPVIITWALVAVNGMEVAPYYLLFLMSATYYLYVLPSRSSFRMPAKGKPKAITSEMDELDELVMGRYETAVHTIAYCLLPVLFKLSIHHRHLFTSRDDVADCLLLSSLPMLLVLSMSHKGSMWWLGLQSGALGSFRKTMIGVLGLVLVGCLELRVVMHTFSMYIKLMPPYNYIVVTTAMYLLALIVLAHFAGYLESDRAMWVLALIAVAASSCVCIALGMPYYMVPFGAAGAVFWVRFYYYRKLNDYLSFVGTSSLAIFWFIIRTFMFLDFEFDPLPMSLQHVSCVLMAVVLSSLLIPGLLVVNKNQIINGAIMCIHAAGMTLLELQLHCQFKGIYPSYIVLFSSAVGIWLAHFLFKEGRLESRTAWLLGAIYLGKAGLVFHPTPYALPSSLALSLSITPIYNGILFNARPEAPVRPGSMSKQMAVVHMGSVAAALFLTRHTVIKTLVQGGFHRAPPDSLLLGSALLLFPVACSGLAVFHFPTSSRLRRVFAVALSLGAALMMVQPEMSGLREVLSGAADDGDEGGMYRERGWAPWCLLTAALCALSLTSNTARNNWMLKACVAGIGGAAVGMYFNGAYLPASTPLLIVTALASGLTGVLVVFVPTSSTAANVPGGGGLYMQIVFTALVGLLPVAWMLQPAMLKSVRAGVRQEALGMHRVGLLGMYAALCTVLALFIKLRVSSLDAAGPAKPRPGTPSKKVVARTGEESDWLPAIGNVATVVAFGCAVTINISYLGGSESSIFVLAPILLLLSQDNGLFRKLTDEHRYFPLVLVSVGFLILSAVFPLLLRDPLQRHHLIPRSTGPRPETASTLALMKNLGLLLVTVPAHFLFCRFIWNFNHARDLYWVLLLPINLLPILLADLASIRLLAALAIAEGGLQLFLRDRIRRHGQRFV